MVIADFSGKSNMAFYDEAIMEKVKDLDIGLVVLNAGVANFGYFDLVESIKLQEMIDTNVYQYGALLNKFSPILKKRKAKSGMITVSSIAAQF